MHIFFPQGLPLNNYLVSYARLLLLIIPCRSHIRLVQERIVVYRLCIPFRFQKLYSFGFDLKLSGQVI